MQNLFLSLIFACTFVAVDGKVLSGVEVATIIKSIFDALIFEFFIALFAASNAKSEFN